MIKAIAVYTYPTHPLTTRFSATSMVPRNLIFGSLLWVHLVGVTHRYMQKELKSSARPILRKLKINILTLKKMIYHFKHYSGLEESIDEQMDPPNLGFSFV